MKQKPDEVDYSFGKPEAHCGLCTHFDQQMILAGTCQKVTGVVIYYDWCRLFTRRTDGK